MNTPDYAQEDLSVSKEMRRGREPSDDSSSASPSFAASRARHSICCCASRRASFLCDRDVPKLTCSWAEGSSR